jgi:hypothetical protein
LIVTLEGVASSGGITAGLPCLVLALGVGATSGSGLPTMAGLLCDCSGIEVEVSGPVASRDRADDPESEVLLRFRDGISGGSPKGLGRDVVCSAERARSCDSRAVPRGSMGRVRLRYDVGKDRQSFPRRRLALAFDVGDQCPGPRDMEPEVLPLFGSNARS